MTNKSLGQLRAGLDCYQSNGYVESNSFNDPNDDALEYLGMLLVDDQPTALKYCQSFLQQSQVNDELKSAALDFLLLSSEWNFAYQYLYSQAERLSIPELEKSFFYFCCDKNEATPYPVPEGLFTKLLARFEVVKNEPDAYFYHLHEAYNDFVKTLSDTQN
ncbi:hypothetical protein ACP4QI_017150 [Leclercia sp. TB492]|uniref:hypothetical protein n=1 Tax=Leclercia sp. TB492 TaxID=3412682 RepID=UPI003CEB2181